MLDVYHPRMNNKVIYFSTSVFFAWSLAFVSFLLPQCYLSKGFETFLFISSFILFFIIFGPLVFYARISEENERKIAVFFFSLFICYAPAFFSTMYRHSISEMNYWDFEGEITNKYISKNHAAKSIIVNSIKYERIPSHIWQVLSIGDTITKQPCNNRVIVNGIEYIFIK